MAQSQTNDSISYLELPLTDVDGTKSFYSSLFGWQFKDWGPDYLSFSGAKVKGGFNRERNACGSGTGTLVVLFTDDLEAKFAAVKEAGREICCDIFGFPGGRRFHFLDPNGNEIAIWSNSTGE